MEGLDDVLRCFSLLGGEGEAVYRSESSVPCNSVRGGQQKTVAVNMAANLYSVISSTRPAVLVMFWPLGNAD